MCNEENKTKLTLSQGDITMTWEGPWDSGINEIMEGFIGCLRGITFGDWVISLIADWCDEQLIDKHIIENMVDETTNETESDDTAESFE